MKIVHVWDSEYPWDVRVEKISKSLIQAGHEIHLVCSNRTGKIREEIIDGIHIHRLPSFRRFPSLIRATLSFPLFFNPIWIQGIHRVVKEVKAQVIIVRDLPLAPTAIWVGKALSCPVVFDMAENYPLMLESILKLETNKLTNSILRNPKLAHKVEQWTLRNVNHTLVVIEESRDRLLGLGVPKDKISIICNTPIRETYVKKHDLPSEHFFRDEKSLVLIYAGLTNPSRGLDVAVEAMAIVVKKNPHIHLVVIGKGKHDAKLRKIVDRYGLRDHVLLKGWVSHEAKYQYLQHSHIGLIPYRITSHWNTTIPNKLFDYMSMKQPVISSNIRPTARIINEERCGFIVYEHTADQMAKVILKSYDPTMRSEAGQRGFDAIQRRYNWEFDSKELCKVFDEDF